MTPRSQIREQSAHYLNSIGPDELFDKFSITRVARIDGLDCVGVPVYSVCRPAAKSVSVNAGKSVDGYLARAGAVAEGIEFSTFENPVGEFWIDKGLMAPLEWFPLSKDSDWTPDTEIATEDVTVWGNGARLNMPSDLVWLDRRKRYTGPVMWQMSSNGQAIGASFEDALLQGIYECVERDQTVLRMCSQQYLNIWPPRIEVSQTLQEICTKLHRSSLKLYLFYCTYDIPIPCYWAILVDPFGGCGTFGGWGCDLNPVKSAERAILEAIQSRCVYIAGARDDIERRNFELLKSKDPKELIDELDALPIQGRLPDFGWNYSSVQAELDHVRDLLGPWYKQVCYRHIDLGDLHAVKVMILGLEQPITPYWKSVRWTKLTGLST